MFPEYISQFAEGLTVEHGIAAGGAVLLGVWLLRTSFGRRSLADAPERPNDLPFYMPFLLLFMWFAPAQLLVVAVQSLAEDLPEWQKATLGNTAYVVASVGVSVMTLVAARRHFRNGLTGFGLRIAAAPRDLGIALLNLLAVWPVIMAAMLLTIKAAQLIWGEDYEMPQHEGLRLITEHSNLLLRVSIVVVASIMAPLVEELLFRGMLQTLIRSVLMYGPAAFVPDAGQSEAAPGHEPKPEGIAGKDGSAWPAIGITSLLFAIVHADMGHWPALFVLSLALGYSYERSGSLLRPIFIHFLFNTITVIAVLYQ